MNTTTAAQRTNKRQDAIYERAMALNKERDDKAQHSPLPWSYSGIDDCIMAKVNGQRIVVAQIMDGIAVENEDKAFIVRAVNNVEALAEALRFLIGCSERGLDQSATYDGLSNCKAIADARNALKQWESA